MGETEEQLLGLANCIVGYNGNKSTLGCTLQSPAQRQKKQNVVIMVVVVVVAVTTLVLILAIRISVVVIALIGIEVVIRCQHFGAVCRRVNDVHALVLSWLSDPVFGCRAHQGTH